MAEVTKKCPKCKEEIAGDAKKCKHCGADLRNWFIRHKVWTGVLTFFVLIIVISVANGGGKPTTTTTEKSENKEGTATTTTTTTTKKFNIDDIYAQINTGMTEAEVKTIVTQDPINCTESETQGIGTVKLCTYGNVFTDSGLIMVTYSDGKVFSKTKSQF